MNVARLEPPAFLRTRRLYLTPLGPEHVGQRYLDWLNDPEVLRYRGPKAWPTGEALLRDFVERASRSEVVLAVHRSVERDHIGNVALNGIDWVHGSAELSILIGAKETWGNGYGGECIAVLAEHSFRSMRLHRVWAESPNPAFNAAVRRLGWRHEGTKREAFLLDGRFVDVECWGILAHEATGHL